MKIIKKAKILPFECILCGSICKPKQKDLRNFDKTIKDHVICPICGAFNKVMFKKGGE